MIANHAKSDGSGAWPSIHTLAKESRLSDRTVQRCIGRLKRTTHNIKPELLVRTGRGPYGSNLYDIPGVKLSPPGVKTGIEGVSDTVTTPVSQLSHPNRPLTVSKDKETSNTTPLPPASGGMIFSWCGEKIEVQMGRRKRLPTFENYAGARAFQVADFLNRRGFPAKVLEEQLVS